MRGGSHVLFGPLVIMRTPAEQCCDIIVCFDVLLSFEVLLLLSFWRFCVSTKNTSAQLSGVMQNIMSISLLSIYYVHSELKKAKKSCHMKSRKSTPFLNNPGGVRPQALWAQPAAFGQMQSAFVSHTFHLETSRRHLRKRHLGKLKKAGPYPLVRWKWGQTSVAIWPQISAVM